MRRVADKCFIERFPKHDKLSGMKIEFRRKGNIYFNAGVVGIAVILDNYELWSADMRSAPRERTSVTGEGFQT